MTQIPRVRGPKPKGSPSPSSITSTMTSSSVSSTSSSPLPSVPIRSHLCPRSRVRTLNRVKFDGDSPSSSEESCSPVKSFIISVLLIGLFLFLLLVGIDQLGYPTLIEACYKFPEGTHDPCLSLDCPFGAECVRDKDGKTANCICPAKCYTYGDSVGSRPVCGSDGRDYANDCELRRRACTRNTHIASRFQGRCDPCDQVDCPVNQVCQLDDQRNPICRCNAVCNREFKPVCASDGKTYINECILRVEACKSKKSLRILYNGECGSGRGTNPCGSLKCNHYQECEIDRYGIATCVCPDTCPSILIPVCGSDGVTYDNECELRRTSCLKHNMVTVSFRGSCDEVDTCRKLSCSHGSVCTIKPSSSEGTCECPSCSEEFKPVCGNNGLTYQNECHLKRYTCQHGVDIRMDYTGPCKGCESKHCDNYGMCRVDGSCSCPESCSTQLNSTTICGTDGVTYDNECELRRASCLKRIHINVQSKRPCDVCLNVVCKYGARCDKGHCVCPTECPDLVEPVCSTHGVTFTNECHLRKQSCQRNLDIQVSFYGECSDASKKHEVADTIPFGSGGYVKTCDPNTCRFGGNCDYDPNGIPHCICSYQCPKSNLNSDQETVCGSDGRLYDNECKLQEETCRRQQEIKPQSHRLCEESKVMPCDGHDAPIINPKTGRDYVCGDGSEEHACPSGSYCHKTLHFGKCCKDTIHSKSCDDSMYGCCPDGKTSASGANDAGCPSLCQCNKLGSYSLTCDPISRQCHCKPGVGGLQCDRCEAGFWGLHKISEGNTGCIPCSCNTNGSIRDDCEQMTGRCVCKPGLQGMKCNVCPEGTILDSDGCTDDMRCKFGATCKEVPSRGIQCSCSFACAMNNITSPDGSIMVTSSPLNPVCGSDGVTYPSDCHLKQSSCRLQKKITKLRDDKCRNSGSTESVTATPVRRSTIHKTTPNDFDLIRTTRDLFGLSVSEQMSTGSTAATPTLPDEPVNVPSFSGESFIELTRLQAYTRLTLEVDFVSFTENGVILYNGQTATGEGDFVSVSLRQGYLEFRFNLGSGTEILRSPQKINLGKLTKMVAKRYLKDGTLTVEGQDDVAGKSTGDLKSLDLAENLFVGAVSNPNGKIIDNIGVRQGFVGCLHKLRIGTRDIDLKLPQSKDVIKSYDIIDCSDNPCSLNPCKNEGSCSPDRSHPSAYTCYCEVGFTGKTCHIPVSTCGVDNPCVKGTTCTRLPQGSFSCLCPPGRSGTLCSEVSRDARSVYIPDFLGSSFIQYNTLQNVAQSFVMEVWMVSRSLHGLVLFNGQKHAQGKGDFFSLSITDGHLQFRYDLGAGGNNSLLLVTKNKLQLGWWHKVRITRQKKVGTLQLDDGPLEMGESSGSLSELNLDEPFYIGGHDHLQSLPWVQDGLNGAVQRVVINGDVWDNLLDRNPLTTRNLPEYRGSPCTTDPVTCYNEGLCIPQLNDYTCKCTNRFTGKRCAKPLSKEDMDRPVAFEGNTFMNLPNKIIDDTIFTGGGASYGGESGESSGPSGQRDNYFELSLKTHSKSGLILWTNKGSSLKSDYLAIALSDGFIEASFNLGRQKEILYIRSSNRVDDGKWHLMSLQRNQRHAVLTIDSKSVTGSSDADANELNTDGTLWIGGKKDIPIGLTSSYYSGFVGCIRDFKVDNDLVPLTAYSASSSTALRFCHE